MSTNPPARTHRWHGLARWAAILVTVALLGARESATVTAWANTTAGQVTLTVALCAATLTILGIFARRTAPKES